MRSGVSGDVAADNVGVASRFVADGRPTNDLPAWVIGVMNGGGCEFTPRDHGMCEWELPGSKPWTRGLSAHRLLARSMVQSDWTGLGDELYSLVLESCRRSREQVVRWWCFVPDIGAPVASGLDRYMALNVGRHAAHERRSLNAGALAAASCVGHAGDAVVLHAIVTKADVTAIENPRQTPAWRYSSEFGPQPPAFARAVRVGGDGGAIVVSGTASVRGEATVHEGEFAAQCDETRENLTAILAAGRPGVGLSNVTHARIYVANHAMLPAAHRAFATLGAAREFLVAPLCRRNLFVEVEAYVEP